MDPSNYQKATEELRMICDAWGLDFDNPAHVEIVADKVVRVMLGLSEAEGRPDSASDAQK